MTELCCHNFIVWAYDKMGGLSPPCFQSGGAEAPPAPPISPPLIIHEHSHPLLAPHVYFLYCMCGQSVRVCRYGSIRHECSAQVLGGGVLKMVSG